jgi:predicted negative regulator of RcsB-dependent stress response
LDQRDVAERCDALALTSSPHERAAHFADPLKAWGDILVKQGKRQQALTTYDEALKSAPNWQRKVIVCWKSTVRLSRRR